MKEVRLKKIKMITAIILFLSAFQLIGKTKLSETIDPPSENNIICYAALKKWVCAPADQQEKAQQKAMKLAMEQSDTNDMGFSPNETVKIQTLKPVNIGRQVQELPVADSTQYSVSDFVPRNDEKEQAPQKELAEVSNAGLDTSVTMDEVDAIEQSVVESSSSQVNKKPDPTETRQFQIATTDFGYWQNNYADQWTFQVIGTTNRHHLDPFLLTNNLAQTNHSIVKTQANGADWWVVLTGLYSSREEALSQRHVLPDALAQGAWVRQIKAIDGTGD